MLDPSPSVRCIACMAAEFDGATCPQCNFEQAEILIGAFEVKYTDVWFDDGSGNCYGYYSNGDYVEWVCDEVGR